MRRNEYNNICFTFYLYNYNLLYIVFKAIIPPSLSFYGKCLESVRKRCNVVLVNNERSARFQVTKPNYVRFKIFNPNLVGVELKQRKVVLDRPVAVGFSILELSKVLMYKFWYDVLKTRYENISLCFTGKISVITFLIISQVTLCIERNLISRCNYLIVETYIS